MEAMSLRERLICDRIINMDCDGHPSCHLLSHAMGLFHLFLSKFLEQVIMIVF